MITRVLAAWLLATVLFTSGAYAHGGVGMIDNRCVLRIGPDIMFTGYQPQNSRGEFCDDIPSVGLTVVALDMQEIELRDMLTEIRIIRDDGTHTRMTWSSGLDGRGAGEQGSSRSRHYLLCAAKEISNGNADLPAHLPREWKIHRHRDCEKRTRPDICFPVPVCGWSTICHERGALCGTGWVTGRRGLRYLAIRRPEEAEGHGDPKY